MKNLFNIFFIVILLSFDVFSSVSQTHPKKCLSHLLGPHKKFKKHPLSFAKGFNIFSSKEEVLLKVKGQWEGSSDQYILISKNLTYSKCSDLLVLNDPIQSIASLSTTHIPFLESLNSLKKLRGFSGVKYISSKKARKRLKENKIKNLGYPLQIEKVLKLNPDLILAYTLNDPSLTGLGKLIKLGQKVVFNGEFKESHPLGRFEWIKFMGALLGQLPKANLIFEKGKSRYLSLKNSLINIERPLVIVGRNYQGSWHLPGKKTYFSKLLQDAGANLPWKHKTSDLFLPLPFEAVLKKGRLADFWLPQSPWQSKQDILKEDKRYNLLRPFKKGQIYNNNKRINPWGGNDYWEGALVNPHRLLADLIKIFHPHLLPKHQLYWYQKLQ